MFNAEIKERYILFKTSTSPYIEKYLQSEFRLIERTEKKLNKDACNFTIFEIMDYYKTRNMTSTETLRVLNTHFTLYTEWCLKEGLVTDGQNHYREFDRHRIELCVNRFAIENKIVDRETVLSWVDQLPNPRDKFLLLGLFEMGSMNQYEYVVNARISDLHGNEFHTSKGIVYWSNVLKHIAIDSAETFEYYPMTENSKPSQLSKEDPDLIFKNKNNTYVESSYRSMRRAYNSLSNIFNIMDVGDWMNAKALQDSGIIEYIKNGMKKSGLTASEFMIRPDVKDYISVQYNIDNIEPYFTRLKVRYGDIW